MVVRPEKLCVLLEMGQTMTDLCKNLYDFVKRFYQSTRDLHKGVTKRGKHAISEYPRAHLK